MNASTNTIRKQSTIPGALRGPNSRQDASTVHTVRQDAWEREVYSADPCGGNASRY
jgi:hypothetical protein